MMGGGATIASPTATTLLTRLTPALMARSRSDQELAPLAGPGLGYSWLWLVLMRKRSSKHLNLHGSSVQCDSVILHDRWKTTHSDNRSDGRGFIRPPGGDDFFGDESCWCLAVCSDWSALHFLQQPGENIMDFWQFPTKLKSSTRNKFGLPPVPPEMNLGVD